MTSLLLSVHLLHVHCPDVPVWCEDDLGCMANGQRRGRGDQERGGARAGRGGRHQVGSSVYLLLTTDIFDWRFIQKIKILIVNFRDPDSGE